MASYHRSGKFTPIETALLVYRDFSGVIITTTIPTVWAIVKAPSLQQASSANSSGRFQFSFLGTRHSRLQPRFSSSSRIWQCFSKETSPSRRVLLLQTIAYDLLVAALLYFLVPRSVQVGFLYLLRVVMLFLVIPSRTFLLLVRHRLASDPSR
ncbi:MAG: hypothetical protein IPJ68_06350 [Candidatus Moraniibacteriota bacterium]|nr:MAG: hypothetical protein IPJ68_06350 [Candidatus Moranbacteria bacterium]